MSLLRNEEVIINTPSDFHLGTLDLANGWWEQVKERCSQSDEFYRKLIKHGYFFYSYVLYRAKYYADHHDTKIDVNDFEDAKMLLHLAIDDDVTFLTSDKGLKGCVQKTIETLNCWGDDYYKTNVQVLDTETFLSMG